MPIPQSNRGNPITSSAIEAPFETPVYPYGMGGLNLAAPVDRVPVGQFTRLTNATFLPNAPGGITSRPGLTELLTGTGNFHTIARFSDPEAATFTYLAGVGTTLGLAASGAVTVVDTGYSGDPLTLLPYHPPLSGDPWMFVGDSAKMRKVRFDGLDVPIALPAPTVAAVTTLDTVQTTPIVEFAAGDGSEAANWTVSGGAVADNGESAAYGPAAPGALSVTDATQQGGTTCVRFAINGGLVPSGYEAVFGFFGLAVTRDLTVVGAGTATDADAMHLLLSLENPKDVVEIRVYFVVSPVFTPGVLPGIPAAPADPPPTDNTDFYVKAFRPDDFSSFLMPSAARTAGSPESRVHTAEDQGLSEASTRDGYGSVRDHDVQRVNAEFLDTQDPVRAATRIAPAGSLQSVEFGTIGISLRRGDFRRYGSTPTVNWSTVTGVIVYVATRVVPPDPAPGNGTLRPVAMLLSDLFLQGGAGPDTMDAATQSYDYRYTHFDPRTGDESNPSPTMADADFLDAIRTTILAAPTAYGDADIRQNFYRRGGILPTDWFYVGVNASDGGVLTDTLSDLEIAAAGTLELDNYEPVPTVDDTGATVLAQPVPVLLGPVNEQLFALGDPHRPGTVYASKPGEPDHWPPDLRCEVCSPGEELMNGVLYGGQILLFSREASYFLYPNLLGATGLTATPAGCTRGLAGRWALTTGAGAIWGVAKDGIFVTTGGPEEIVSDDIAPLFRGQTVHGYFPINLTIETNLRLQFFQRELYFVYEDTDNVQRCLVYTPETKAWRAYVFADNLTGAFTDEVANVLIFGLADRASTHTGVSDNGAAIPVTIRQASWDWGRPREEKLFGDQFLDADTPIELTLTNYVNAETTVNAPQAVPVTSGRARIILDSFGDTPQKGRTLAAEISWSSAAVAPILYQLGTAITPQPDVTINRVTNWDDLGHPDQSYVMGVTFDANTGGEDRTILIERDYLGVISTIATLTINHDGRSKKKYSWPALPANQIRIRPDNDCGAWMLFRADWIAKAEPPRIAVWDAYFENAWDQYITGLDLYCDTEGAQKDLVVEVDGVVILNPATGLGFFPVVTTGRQVVHLTLPTVPPLRGHVLHFTASDANPGLLYDYRWHTVPEPSEQANWNQPFTIMGTQADKWVKAVVFEVDTFGEDKTVLIEADGVVVDTVTVTADGRKVVQLAIPQQLGRVWRFLPSDDFPSRLYSLRLVFDEEPFALTRWETQEIDHEQQGFHSIVEMMLTLKTSAEVNLQITTYVNQTGTTVVDNYTLPTTGGLKLKTHVEPLARKGVLYKYLFTCDQSFWLYLEESQITIQPWEGGAAQIKQPFGNSDVDRTRRMVNASIAAARDGGGS